jgi:CDGSH-type Zn-finger protein
MNNTTNNNQTTITITKNGPIKVVGNFTLKAINDYKTDSGTIKELYLCACGRSQNKPFCDGSHKK